MSHKGFATGEDDPAACGRKGGSKTSERKAVAAALNPRKWCDKDCKLYDECPYRRNPFVVLGVAKRWVIDQINEGNVVLHSDEPWGYDSKEELIDDIKHYGRGSMGKVLRTHFTQAKRDEMREQCDIDPYHIRPRCALKTASADLQERVRNLYDRGLEGLEAEGRKLLDKLLDALDAAIKRGDMEAISIALSKIAQFKKTFYGDTKTLDVNMSSDLEGVSIAFEDAEGESDES